MAEPTKTYTKCGETKPLSEFTKNKLSRGGRHSQCNVCRNKANQRYYQTDAGRAVQRAGHKRYRQTDKGRTDIRQRARQRRARKAGAAGSHTHAQFVALCEATGFRCLRCGHQFPLESLTEDHVTPLSRGGSDSIANIQPLCQSCNSSKGTASTDYRGSADQDLPRPHLTTVISCGTIGYIHTPTHTGGEMGKQLSVRVPDWLYEALSKEAATEERSIGGQVRHLLGLHYVSKGYEEGQEEEAE